MPTTVVPPDSPGAMLDLVRSGQTASRSDIARVTGVSASTAAIRVQALIDHGYLREAGPGDSRGGRRPRRVELRTDAGAIAAADLGSHHASFALFDLGGRLLLERHRSMRIDDGPNAVLGWVNSEVLDMLNDLGDRLPLRGLAVGVPGPVDCRAGKVISPSRMPGWNGTDVRAVLAEVTSVPVFVDNDANLMALGEYTARRVIGQHLVFVKAGSGIGCGVIVGGRLHHGSVGAAGDISHVSVSSATQVPCSCGRIGCLDAVASGSALARDLRAGGFDVVDTGGVVNLARDAEPLSARMLRDAGRATGEVLATIVNFFNPNILALGGQLSQAEAYVAGVRSTLYERCLPMAMETLEVVLSLSGPLAGVTGGAQLVLEYLFDPGRVNAAIQAAEDGTASNR